jgi:hypothetical protein
MYLKNHLKTHLVNIKKNDRHTRISKIRTFENGDIYQEHPRSRRLDRRGPAGSRWHHNSRIQQRHFSYKQQNILKKTSLNVAEYLGSKGGGDRVHPSPNSNSFGVIGVHPFDKSL